MKILLLNQVFYPDVVATAQHLSDLAKALAERGHEVTVVSSRRAYEHPDTLFPARETWRGVKIIRVFSTRFGKGAKWRRAADFASFLFFCGARLLFLPRHDVVMALTTPPLISFLGAWRAKLWRAKFCYWVMDFNPDEAIAAGWLQADSPAAKLLERLSRFSLQQANQIVALDRFMRDRIVAKGIAPEKIAVIPPWSQDQDVRFDMDGRDKFRTAHGWQNKFVVMYSGNHSPVHPLDTLMLAADQLRGETDLVFAFIGGGSEFPRIKKWAATWDKAESGERRAEIICLPYQPLEKLSASLSAADGHVVVMGNAMLGLVHPCKIYNIFAVGAPVVYIGPEPSHVTEAVAATAGTNANVNVRHGQAGRLAAEILRLKQNWPTEGARSAGAVEQFSAMRLLPQMVALLEASQPAGSQGRGG
jgi:glycosyltransferase involved in cell wall biosynthesis